MQATSPTFRAITDTGGITTAILVLIALGALLTVTAILYGMRLARQRRAARRVEDARVEAEAPDEPVAVPSERVPAAAPPPPEPAPALAAADPLPLAPDLADEPVAAAAPLHASPAAEAEPEPAPPTEPEPAGPPPADRPLTLLKGLGPKVAARLEELGVASVGDLARLSPAEAEALDARLGPFTGRMARDRWLDQARLLASGDDRAFEAEFGKL